MSDDNPYSPGLALHSIKPNRAHVLLRIANICINFTGLLSLLYCFLMAFRPEWVEYYVVILSAIASGREELRPLDYFYAWRAIKYAIMLLCCSGAKSLLVWLYLTNRGPFSAGSPPRVVRTPTTPEGN